MINRAVRLLRFVLCVSGLGYGAYALGGYHAAAAAVSALVLLDAYLGALLNRRDRLHKALNRNGPDRRHG